MRKTSSSIAPAETSVEQKDSFGDLFGLTTDSATSITSSRSSGYQSQPDFTSEGETIKISEIRYSNQGCI